MVDCRGAHTASAKRASTEKELPTFIPTRLDFRTTTVLWESYSKEKEFGTGKELAQNDTEKGDLGPWGTGGRWGVLRVDRQRSDGGGPHAGRVGHCRGGSAMRSPDAPSSFQSEGESPRFQLLLPGPRADQLVQKAAEVCLQSPAAP